MKLLSYQPLDMTADKQTEGKVSTMDENKENSPDGGLGLESILCKPRCYGCGVRAGEFSLTKS